MINKKNSSFVNFNSIKGIIVEGKEIELPPFELFIREKVRPIFT